MHTYSAVQAVLTVCPLPCSCLPRLLPVHVLPQPQLCFFAHSESQLRARTGVKSYSGGRRSGRRHRAAAALRNALAGSAFGTPSARGSSNGLCFLQVPSPPGTDVSSGSSGNLMQLDPATHEALARLSLASTQQAGVAPVTLAQLQAPVLILQDGTAACSSADMLPTVSSNTAAYAAGSMPLSTGALSAGSDLVSTQGLGLGAVPAGSRQSLGVAAGVSMHSMSQAAGVLPLACNPPGTGLAAPSNSSAWPVGLTAQQQLLLAQQHQLLPLPIEQTPVLQSAQVQNQLLSSPESLWFPPAGSAGLDLGMAGVTAAVQPAVSSNALSIFAPVSAASLVQGASMDSAAVLQAQQLSMQLAAAGILPQGLPPAAGGDACQCPVLLLNYMGQQL